MMLLCCVSNVLICRHLSPVTRTDWMTIHPIQRLAHGRRWWAEQSVVALSASISTRFVVGFYGVWQRIRFLSISTLRLISTWRNGQGMAERNQVCGFFTGHNACYFCYGSTSPFCAHPRWSAWAFRAFRCSPRDRCTLSNRLFRNIDHVSFRQTD